jgi:hypothetical protein
MIVEVRIELLVAVQMILGAGYIKIKIFIRIVSMPGFQYRNYHFIYPSVFWGCRYLASSRFQDCVPVTWRVLIVSNKISPTAMTNNHCRSPEARIIAGLISLRRFLIDTVPGTV